MVSTYSDDTQRLIGIGQAFKGGTFDRALTRTAALDYWIANRGLGQAEAEAQADLTMKWFDSWPANPTLPIPPAPWDADGEQGGGLFGSEGTGDALVWVQNPLPWDEAGPQRKQVTQKEADRLVALGWSLETGPLPTPTPDPTPTPPSTETPFLDAGTTGGGATPEELVSQFLSGQMTYRDLLTGITARFADLGFDTPGATAQTWLDTTGAQLGVVNPTETAVSAQTTGADPFVSPLELFGTEGSLYGSPEQRRAAQFEEFEYEPKDVFQQFLARQPLGPLSGLGQRALQRQYEPAFTSYVTGLQDPTQTFRSFLTGLDSPRVGQAGIASPEEIAQRFVNIGGLFDQSAEGLRGAEAVHREKFASNPFSFATALQALQGTVSPFFRSAAGAVAKDIYDRFQGTTPEMPFIQELARRGGRFF